MKGHWHYFYLKGPMFQFGWVLPLEGGGTVVEFFKQCFEPIEDEL